MILLLITGCVLSLSWAEPQERKVFPPFKFDLRPPPGNVSPSARIVFESYMPMPIDHFDPQNRDVFLMRFMFNEEFLKEDGAPIFILVGGEWEILTEWLQSGNMYEMARENGGYQVYTEHRYYGETLPFRNFTTENLRFLNVDQALADLAYFINNLKQIPRFAKSEVILYGGSYAGNMVLWFKQRYPHLVKGVVASSAPIKGKVDFTGYLELVHEAFLSEGGEECIGHIREGIVQTIQAMNTEQGRRQLEQAYSVCDPLDYDDRFTLGYLSGMISWSLSGAVQQAIPGSLRAICRNFTTDFYGNTPMQKMAGFIKWINDFDEDEDCYDVTYQAFLDIYSDTEPNTYRAWYYQTCTEYGYFQTAPNSGTVFDVLHWLSVEFYVDICKRAYSETFDEQFVYNAVERVNNVFGGLEPNVNNTINIHGHIDPWRVLGVYDEDLAETSPTINVPRASHCFDMRQWLPSDTILMTQAQQRARRLVASWLSK